MSQENLEVVRRAYADYPTAPDTADLAVIVARYCDEEVEWHPAQEPRPLRGHEGVVRAMQGWFEAMTDLAIEPVGLSDHGDAVVARVRISGRGTASGVMTSAEFFHVFTMRDGRILRFRELTNEADALKAAGLSE